MHASFFESFYLKRCVILTKRFFYSTEIFMSLLLYWLANRVIYRQ